MQKGNICYLEFTDKTRVKIAHKFVLATVCNIKTDKSQLSIGEFDAIDHVFQFAYMNIFPRRKTDGLTNKQINIVECKQLQNFKPPQTAWPNKSLNLSSNKKEPQKKVQLCL